MKRIIHYFIYPLGLIMMSGMMQTVAADKTVKATNKKLTSSSQYFWYDGKRKKTIWLNPNLIAEFDPKPASHRQSKNLASSASPVKIKQRGIKLWRLKTGTTSKSNMQQLRQQLPAAKISRVLHDGPSAATHKRALPGNIIVHLDPNWDQQQVMTWLNQHALQIEKPLNIGPNIFIVKTGPGLEALEKANEIYLTGEVVAAYPDWWQEIHKK